MSTDVQTHEHVEWANARMSMGRQAMNEHATWIITVLRKHMKCTSSWETHDFNLRLREQHGAYGGALTKPHGIDVMNSKTNYFHVWALE